MEGNIGLIDKIARLIIGVSIISLGFTFKTWWGIIGVIPLATGIIGWCPLYHIIKISTQKKKK